MKSRSRGLSCCSKNGLQRGFRGSIAQAQRVLSPLEPAAGPDLSICTSATAPTALPRRGRARLLGYDVAAILITGDTSHEEIAARTRQRPSVLFKPVQARARLYNVVRGLVS